MSTGLLLIGAAVALHGLTRLWLWCGEMAALAVKDEDDMEEDPSLWSQDEWQANYGGRNDA